MLYSRAVRLSLLIIVPALLLGLCSCMPQQTAQTHAKQLARNEEKLKAEGIVALEPGTPAPAFSAQGTQGSSLSIGTLPTTEAPTEAGSPDLPAANGGPTGAADGATAGTPEAVDTPGEATADGTSPEAPASGETVTGAADTPAGGAPVKTPGAQQGSYYLLLFFPAVDTPNSAKEFIEFGKASSSLEAKGVTAYGITRASLADLETFSSKYGIKVPLLSDADGSICISYGCLAEGGEYPQRTAVGIAPDGKLAFYHRGTLTSAAALQLFKLDPKSTAPETAPAK